MLDFEYNVPVSEYLFSVRKYGSKRTLVTKTSHLKSSLSLKTYIETYIETLKHTNLNGHTSGSWLSHNSVACKLFIKKKKKCLLIRKLDCFVTQRVRVQK